MNLLTVRISRLNKMDNLISIAEPIWSTKSVGLDERILRSNSVTFVDITYTNKRKWRIWPNRFYIFREEALTYPTQRRYGVTLRIVPIEKLHVCETASMEDYKRWLERKEYAKEATGGDAFRLATSEVVEEKPKRIGKPNQGRLL